MKAPDITIRNANNSVSKEKDKRDSSISSVVCPPVHNIVGSLAPQRMIPPIQIDAEKDFRLAEEEG